MQWAQVKHGGWKRAFCVWLASEAVTMRPEIGNVQEAQVAVGTDLESQGRADVGFVGVDLVC